MITTLYIYSTAIVPVFAFADMLHCCIVDNATWPRSDTKNVMTSKLSLDSAQ